MKNEGVYVILHNIRSSENVGAMFRTSDAADVSKIYLTGYTPAPRDRFNRPSGAIAKAALGAEEYIAWEAKKLLAPLIRQLKKDGVQIVAIEQDARAVDYKKLKIQKPVAFIVGNEVTGLTKHILALCDRVAEIPMKGKKESLNVSVSLGIALFRILGI